MEYFAVKKTVAIIQARMSSNRFPGKVIKPIGGMPAILLMMRRLQAAKKVDHILVATSLDKSDDELAQIIQSSGLDCYRGDLGDVLARFYNAAKACDADIVVRITGDCPLVDPTVVDQVVSKLIETKSDYATNTLPPTYPDGLDVEAFTFEALEYAYIQAKLNSEREHVTPFIRNHPELFKIVNIEGDRDLSHLRWTIDYLDDYHFVNRLIELVDVEDIAKACFVDFLRAIERHTELSMMNIHRRNEGYELSLNQDGKVKS
jgi:spore coat polysaccharide biosynthesis protein SpsF